MMKQEKLRAFKKRRAIRKNWIKKNLIVGFLSLCLLTVAAFAVPQAVFGIQDSLLYGECVLGPQEDIDAAALSTNYESSLYQRLRNFAEAVEKGEAFYVDEKELKLTEEIVDILYSENIFLGPTSMLPLLVDTGLVPSALFEVIWTDIAASVRQYKQYVVYNDNYAQGVNFILWFFEFQNEEGMKLSLLMDAQDYTVYAVETDGNEMQHQGRRMYENYVQLWRPDLLWFMCCGYYHVFDMATAEKFMSVLHYTQQKTDSIYESEVIVSISSMEEAVLLTLSQIAPSAKRQPVPVPDTNGADVNVLWRDGMLYDYDDGEWFTTSDNGYELKLPYQNETINYCLRLFGDARLDAAGGYLFPDVQCGIYDLCQLIPEFRSYG